MVPAPSYCLLLQPHALVPATASDSPHAVLPPPHAPVFNVAGLDVHRRCRTHPAVAGRTAGSGQEAAQTCYVRDFLWVNHEESSGRPNATSCSLAAARHGPLCPIRTS
eukprot:scaffold4502_cov119-Isochrysis_galbana.AAC.21